MNANEWEKHIAGTFHKKFGCKWTVQDRLLSIVSQCGEVAEKVQFDEGKRKKDKSHVPLNLMVSAIFLDAFVLADELGVDLEKSLAKALACIKMCKR